MFSEIKKSLKSIRVHIEEKQNLQTNPFKTLEMQNKHFKGMTKNVKHVSFILYL